MKRRISNLICSALIAVAGLALGSLRTNAQNGAAKPSGSSSGSLANVERAANLYGRELMSSDNQKIGKVQNVIVDLPSEHVLYVVVGTDQRSYVAVPPQVFGNTSANTVRLNATKQQIDSAPRFAGNINQPGQINFLAQVYQHFGQSQWWQSGVGSNPSWFHSSHKLNQLLGMRVQDPQSKILGKVSNMVVDMPSGHIMYVVLAPDSSLNLGDNLYAVPSDSLHLTSDGKAFTMDTDPQKLAAAPHFPSNQWPNLTDANFASQVYQYYGKSAWFGNSGGNQPVAPTGR